MSSTELHIGKLREIKLDGKPVEDVAKAICEAENYEIEDHESYLDVLTDIYPRKYFLVKDKLYEVAVDIEYIDEDEYISNMVENKDGDFEYVMQFYNGGTCFSEMIEDALLRRLK